MIEQSFCVDFTASNNEAEYEALITGLRLTKTVGAKFISAFCDSQLVANQISGEFETRDERMEAYAQLVKGMTNQFEKFELTRIPRGENTTADALAALASTSNPTISRIIPVEAIKQSSITTKKHEHNGNNRRGGLEKGYIQIYPRRPYPDR